MYLRCVDSCICLSNYRSCLLSQLLRAMFTIHRKSFQKNSFYLFYLSILIIKIV